MKLKELKKVYGYDENKQCFILDVQLEDYRDAYSDWDFSPFANRDLDDDLIDYLLECSIEIPKKYDVAISFHILNFDKDEKREEKSIHGMYNYFGYRIRKLRNQKMIVIKDMFTFLIVGSILLGVGSYLNKLLSESMWTTILSEGFSIGGWVMLWEMFSFWFFDMNKLHKKSKEFERLNQSEISFVYKKGDQ